MSKVFIRQISLFCLSLFAAIACAQAADYYVATQGSDSNPGTASQPFRTITRAYTLASAGTTIYVSPGTYTDYTTGWGLRLSKNGTASSPITLKSAVKGGAIIDGQNDSTRNRAIYVSGSYNVVDGFVVRGGPNGGFCIYGHNNKIINNEIHNNGNPASDSTNGKDGIYSNQGVRDNYYANNYVHDNGRTGSNLDHGFYLCGNNERVINNVVLRNAATGIQVAGYSTVSGMKIYNNVVAYNGTSGIILWLSLNGVEIKNNIVYRNGSWGVNSYDGHGSGVVVEHNAVFGNGSGAYNWTAGGSDYSYNLGTTITSDPLLVNGNSTAFDARLRPTSPCVKAGVNLYSVFTTDKDGVARASSGSWDLGPYVSGSITPGAMPTISSIANRIVGAGSSTGPILFTVNDGDTAANNLVVTASSSNTGLVPNANIVLGGSGNNRIVTVTAASGQSGTATITLRVSDGQQSTATNFVLTIMGTVAPPTLEITRNQQSIQIRWPTNAGKFVLQSRGITSSLNAWADAANVPAIDKEDYLISYSASEVGKLYRLRSGVDGVPTLKISRNQPSIQIRWPTNAGKFVLQSRRVTSSLNAWADVTIVPSIDKNDYLISNVASEAGRVYRLRGQ